MNLVKTHIEIFCSTKLWLKFISQHPPEQRGRVMSYQAESQSTINEVLLLIAVLQRIPKNRWVSSTEIRKGLAAEGIDLMPRRLQRFLVALVECEAFHIEVDRRGNHTATAEMHPIPHLTKVRSRRRRVCFCACARNVSSTSCRPVLRKQWNRFSVHPKRRSMKTAKALKHGNGCRKWHSFRIRCR